MENLSEKQRPKQNSGVRSALARLGNIRKGAENKRQQEPTQMQPEQELSEFLEVCGSENNPLVEMIKQNKHWMFMQLTYLVVEVINDKNDIEGINHPFMPERYQEAVIFAVETADIAALRALYLIWKTAKFELEQNQNEEDSNSLSEWLIDPSTIEFNEYPLHYHAMNLAKDALREESQVLVQKKEGETPNKSNSAALGEWVSRRDIYNFLIDPSGINTIAFEQALLLAGDNKMPCENGLSYDDLLQHVGSMKKEKKKLQNEVKRQKKQNKALQEHVSRQALSFYL